MRRIARMVCGGMSGVITGGAVVLVAAMVMIAFAMITGRALRIPLIFWVAPSFENGSIAARFMLEPVGFLIAVIVTGVLGASLGARRRPGLESDERSN